MILVNKSLILLLSVVRLSSTFSPDAVVLSFLLDSTSLFDGVSFWIASTLLLVLAGCTPSALLFVLAGCTASTFFSTVLLEFVVKLFPLVFCCLFASTLFVGTSAVASWALFTVVATSVLFSSTLSLACALDPKKSIEPIATEAIPTVNFLIEYFIILSFLNIYFSLIFTFYILFNFNK